MTIDELSRFCGAAASKLAAPWSEGEYSYATNGFLLVRVPRVEGIEERSNAVDLFVIDKYISRPTECCVPLPEGSKPILKRCPICYGKGKRSECPECNGEGMVEWSTDRYAYEAACKMCDGDGDMIYNGGDGITCSRCYGVGKVWPEDLVAIEGVTFTTRILQLVCDLPGFKIELKPGTYPLKFIFDGGDGVIMPGKTNFST